MFLQPSLQSAGGLSGGIFTTGSTVRTGIAADDDDDNGNNISLLVPKVSKCQKSLPFLWIYIKSHIKDVSGDTDEQKTQIKLCTSSPKRHMV